MKSTIIILITALTLKINTSVIIPNTHIIDKVQEIILELNQDEQEKLKEFTEIGINKIKNKRWHTAPKNMPKVIL